MLYNKHLGGYFGADLSQDVDVCTFRTEKFGTQLVKALGYLGFEITVFVCRSPEGMAESSCPPQFRYWSTVWHGGEALLSKRVIPEREQRLHVL